MFYGYEQVWISSTRFIFGADCAAYSWAAPAATGRDSADKKTAIPATLSPEDSQKQSLTADAVRKVTGQPDAIKPMKAPDGKAEIWIYRRVVEERFLREQAGSVPFVVSVPDADGTLRQYTVGGNARYVDVKSVTEDIIELLMFNGRYVTQKITRREYKRRGDGVGPRLQSRPRTPREISSIFLSISKSIGVGPSCG